MGRIEPQFKSPSYQKVSLAPSPPRGYTPSFFSLYKIHLFFFAVLGIELRALLIVGRRYTTELTPSPPKLFFLSKLIIISVTPSFPHQIANLWQEFLSGAFIHEVGAGK
jgi:hypothetical protein